MILGLSFFLKPLRSSDFKVFGLFLVLVFSCSLNFGFDVQARRSVLNIFIALLFVRVTADYFSFRFLKIASFWMLGVLLFNLTMCAQQYFKIDPLFAMPSNLGHLDSMVGFLRMKVHLGSLLAVISPVIFFASPVMALLAVPMLCVANSSAAVVSYAVSIGLLILLKMKRIYAILAVVVILVAGGLYVYKFDLPGGQFKERFKVWNAVYGEGLKRNPFFGSGSGSYAKLNLMTMQKNGEPQVWTWAHNEYIQSFFEFGFIGLGLIVIYLKGVFKGFIRNWKDSELQVLFASMIAVVGVSFLHFPFHIARLAIPCLFVMGLYQGKLEDLENEG
jgi:O-antigen ligase